MLQFVILISFATASAHADVFPTKKLRLHEADSSPDGYFYDLTISNGTLTDNGDGTGTLITGGSAIGGAVTGGTEGSVLFLGSGGVLAQDNSHLFYNDSTDTFTVTSPDNTGIAMLSGNSGNHTAIGVGRSAVEGRFAIAAGAAQYSDLSSAGDFIVLSNTDDLILSARNATGNIYFGTGAPDTAKMTISNAGYVGIGDTTPDYPLEVTKSVTGNYVVSIYNEGVGTNDHGLLIDTAQNGNNLALDVKTSGTTQFSVRNGFVSMGTSHVNVASGKGLYFDSNHIITPWDGSKGYISFSGGDSFQFLDTTNSNRVAFKLTQTENVFNEDGVATLDFRVEGDTNANLFFVDASTDRVGVGTNTPAALFHVHAVTGIDPNLSLSDADVAHGITQFGLATDTIFKIQNSSGTGGGALLTGLTDEDTNPFTLYGVFGVTDPTDTTPAVTLQGAKKNGANTQALGASETVLSVQNGTYGSGTVLLSTLGSGTTTLTINNSSSKGFIIKGAASQSANLIEAQNSSGTALFTVGSAGRTVVAGDELQLTASGTAVINFTAATTGLIASAGNFIMQANSVNILTLNSSQFRINGLDATATMNIPTMTDVQKGAVIRANSATQSANLFEAQNSSGTALLTVSSAGKLSIPVSSSTDLAPVGGVLFDHYADAGNTGTGEDDLYTDTLAASTLGADGDKILARYSGVITNDPLNTDTIRAYFGGTKIFDSGDLTANTVDQWDLDIVVIRASSSSVRCIATLTGNTNITVTNYTLVSGLTLTNTQIIKITGEETGTAVANNNILAKLGTISFMPAA